MRKILLIGLKDLTLAFRDRTALLLMLAAPFVLTIGLGVVTGRFSGANTGGLSNIPVLIVNHDQGDLGQALVDLFHTDELAELVQPGMANDLAIAKKDVDDDQIAAVVYIPAGFTDNIIPRNASAGSVAPIQIEIYANPARPTSAGVIQSIVDEFISRVEVSRVSGQAAVTQLILSGRIKPEEAEAVGREIGIRQAEAAAAGNALIRLNRTTSGSEPATFDVLAYLAPGMALMFLMYTVANGGRSILAERAGGTLPRLLISPTTNAQALGGKLLGIYLTGVAQMGILILASSLMFRVQWGDPLVVAALILAVVAGAAGWGALLAAFAQSSAQVGSLGTAMMLIFAILGGSFISLNNLPAWVQVVSKITPNAWALDGFTTLSLGGALSDIATPLTALLVMSVVLFAMAILMFRRQGIMQR
ncbi:MAG: linearmycin resistance permease LnrM [Candidatus Promineifilaceae bacterium]